MIKPEQLNLNQKLTEFQTFCNNGDSFHIENFFQGSLLLKKSYSTRVVHEKQKDLVKVLVHVHS